jgi:RNA recognition motif-containing protein
MASKLFVGRLPYATTSEQLNDIFAAHGTVVSAVVIIDKFTNKSKGFGFVEMSTDDEAKAAMKALDGSEVEGRQIVVSEARPQEKRPPREGGFNQHRDSRDRDF